MILLPAIDLKNQKAVRLIQGDFKRETVYSDDPLKLAQAFEEAGATHLHVIDLNGAEAGTMIHETVIKDIISNTNLKLEVGGGIRNISRVQALLELGVNEVIVGSIAVEDTALLSAMVKAYPNRIIVSIDALEGKVLTRGWQEVSTQTTVDFAKSLEAIGIKKIVYTDVAKDGMLEGPNFDDYALLIKETNLDIIASGGVTTYEDIRKLQAMGLYGAIIGKALYEEKIDLKEAISCLPNASSRV